MRRCLRCSADSRPIANRNGLPRRCFDARSLATSGTSSRPRHVLSSIDVLRPEGKPGGRWGADETAVQRLFGKELLVLLWAVEARDVSAEEIAVAIRNWHGLKPEERWWLYTMTAATTGLAHQVGMGWRGALRQALCFGTRSDAFNLSAVAGHGTLEPRAERQVFAIPKKQRARTQGRWP